MGLASNDEKPQAMEEQGGMAIADKTMEHKTETPLEKLLHGHAEGGAVALRGCPDELFAAVRLRFGESVSRVRFAEPCRVEHPHSAYLRKNILRGDEQAVQCTLYAPDGRLTEERSPDGAAFEYFIKKPRDFEVLRGHLRDVELHAAKAQAQCEAETLAIIGLTPLREMETRWAGPEMTQKILISQDESAASCLRKLERHFHHRCEEAVRMGCRAAILRDMAAEPLPETYLPQAGRHIEWMRHAGLFPWVEACRPEAPLFAALNAAHAGARAALFNPALFAEDFTLPEGMKLILDAEAEGFEQESADKAGELLKACATAVLLLNCFPSGQEAIFRSIDQLLRLTAEGGQ